MNTPVLERADTLLNHRKLLLKLPVTLRGKAALRRVTAQNDKEKRCGCSYTDDHQGSRSEQVSAGDRILRSLCDKLLTSVKGLFILLLLFFLIGVPEKV